MVVLSLPMDASLHCIGECNIHDTCRRSLQNAIRQYATPGISPPSARIATDVEVQVRPPFKLWHYWRYGWFLASKATQITGDIVSHTIWGPRKKSWCLEMTLLSSVMRDAARHSALMDLPSIRLLMSIGGLAPLPADALVTPVTFRVRRRRLKGILADYDAKETGHRELGGEWVVGKKTWRRLQAEWKALQLQKGSKQGKARKHTERVVLYIHGGAYIVGSSASQRQISVPLALHTDARVFALDYRLAPESTFPGPLHDVVSGYMRLIDDLNIPSENIIVSGDSAGGGLSLALLMYLRDNAYPMPSGAILMSPWVDLTLSCESWDSNAPFDVVPVFPATNHLNPIASYLGPQLKCYLMHPYASPLFGDFTGLPPLLVQAGDAEVLRDEITLLAHKASAAGVDVRHELYEDCVHVFQQLPFLEACARAFISMGDFVRNTLPQLPRTITKNAEKVMETEIDSANALVINVDGVATSVGVEGAKEGLDADTDPESDDSLKKGQAKRPVRPRHHRSNSQHPEWESIPSQPPSPSVRRNASHVDVSRLVDNWHSGPANQTHMYRLPNQTA